MRFDRASDYPPELAVEARRMCLHVATILGDLLDEIVVVGGLVPYLDDGPNPEKLQNLEADFAAIVTTALPLAFRDFESVVIEGPTLADELATRSVKVCGPAAFVAMKAHAIRLRAKDKDAYDLVYVLKHYGDGSVGDVAARYATFADVEEAKQGLDILRADFASTAHLGSVRAARFAAGRRDAALQADAHGYV